jgi:hypothetical protein
MKEAVKAKLNKLIQEEQKSAVDQEFLNTLHELAAGSTLYDQFTAEERNTLNEFFREMRNYLFEELLTGVYGAQVIIDAIIVLTFEVGYKLKEREVILPSPH